MFAFVVISVRLPIYDLRITLQLGVLVRLENPLVEHGLRRHGLGRTSRSGTATQGISHGQGSCYQYLHADIWGADWSDFEEYQGYECM